MICFSKLWLKRRQRNFQKMQSYFLIVKNQLVLFKASLQTSPLNAFRVSLFKDRHSAEWRGTQGAQMDQQPGFALLKH